MCIRDRPDTWETMDNRVAEGPWVMKYRDRYYMMYNANHTSTAVSYTHLECDVSELLQKTYKRFKPLAREKGLALSIETPESLYASVEREGLTKIISNLLTTAIKYSETYIPVSYTHLTTSGLLKYNRSTDDFTRIPQRKNMFTYNILEDFNGNLWFATFSNGCLLYTSTNPDIAPAVLVERGYEILA